MGKKLEKKGVPAYMVTLGDMWSLMLTFFIMLFAMSTVDATKFKKVEGTLKETFGFRQTMLQYGPPPGVNPVHATSASDHFPDDIIFDHPTQNSINDPEFAARKIVSCERNIRRKQETYLTTKKNGAHLQKILKSEIESGFIIYGENKNEVSLVFSEKQAFQANQEITPSMSKALDKINQSLSGVKGDVAVRSYLPQSLNSNYLRITQQSSAQSAQIGEVLFAAQTEHQKQVRLEVVPFLQHQRVPSSQGFSADAAFFEIAIIKN